MPRGDGNAVLLQLRLHFLDVALKLQVLCLHLHQVLDKDESVVQWHRLPRLLGLNQLSDSLFLNGGQAPRPESLMLARLILICWLRPDHFDILSEAHDLAGEGVKYCAERLMVCIRTIDWCTLQADPLAFTHAEACDVLVDLVHRLFFEGQFFNHSVSFGVILLVIHLR